MVKKNPFTTSSQEKNTLQEVDVSLSKSTIKRRLHQSKHRGVTTRCKQGQIRLCQKKHLKSQTTSGKAFYGHLKLRSTCTRMTGRKKYGEGLEQLMIQSIQHYLWTWWSVMAWACMASSGTGLLVFIDDVTEDRSSRINSEVYKAILSAQIQPNAAKLIGWRFIVQMDNDPNIQQKQPRSFWR